jgi:hypothetical protein
MKGSHRSGQIEVRAPLKIRGPFLYTGEEVFVPLATDVIAQDHALGARVHLPRVANKRINVCLTFAFHEVDHRQGDIERMLPTAGGPNTSVFKVSLPLCGGQVHGLVIGAG